MSQKDPFGVTKFSQYLSTIYGNKLKVKRGDIHDFLGMHLDYSETGVVKVSIIKYLQKVLENLPEELRGTLYTPALDHILQVRGENEAEFSDEYLHL